MAENSQLSHSRLAILTITGLAAAYGIYTVFHAFSDAPAKSALHRSNAIHRPRPALASRRRLSQQRSSIYTVDYSAPTQDHRFGQLLIHHPEFHEVLKVDVGFNPLPTHDELEAFMGEIVDESALQREILLKAIECICHATLCEIHRPWRYESAGLCDLPRAFIAADWTAVCQFHPAIAAMTHRPVTSTDMGEAVERLLDSADTREVVARLLVLHSDDTISEAVNDPETDAMTHAETEAPESRDGAPTHSQEPTQGLKGLLYHIAESDAKRKAYLHRGIHCEGCGERPIRGIRWHCINCPDFDLCSTCEMQTTHPKTHVFAKIQIPLPRVCQPTQEATLWYPGDPTRVHGLLSADVKKRLVEMYGFDEPHIDAHYDQFCCIANVPWNHDHAGIMAGIDRRAFDKALTSERWPLRLRPNALYDRMFAFYDSNEDGIIGFEEFVSGLAYLRGSQRYGSLKRALQGFDIDGDGYLSRQDFLRLFRAKYEIQQLIIGDMVHAQEQERSRLMMDTLRSSQPISSAFNNDEIPPGEIRRPNGKQADVHHDMHPVDGANTILGDLEAWPKEQPVEVVHVNGNGEAGNFEAHVSRIVESFSGLTDRNDNVESEVSNDSQALPQQTFESAHVNHNEASDSQTNFEPSTRYEDDLLLDQDILWHMIESGFNELLDKIFQKAEGWEQQVIDTREEREKWRQEIARFVEEEETLAKKLDGGSEVDPLMATAFDAFANSNGGLQNSESTTTDMARAMVPTDTASLEEREAEISQQSLDGLLQSSGYSVVAEPRDSSTNDNADLSPFPRGPISRYSNSERGDGRQFGLASEADFTDEDPTMPQSRPDTTTASVEASGDTQDAIGPTPVVAIKDTPPSRERLKLLKFYDEVDREIRLRGGPGIVNFEEIEEQVQADESKELRGLVTGWLELASF